MITIPRLNGMDKEFNFLLSMCLNVSCGYPSYILVINFLSTLLMFVGRFEDILTRDRETLLAADMSYKLAPGLPLLRAIIHHFLFPTAVV